MPVPSALRLFIAAGALGAAPLLAETPTRWRGGVIAGLDRTDAAPGSGAVNGLA